MFDELFQFFELAEKYGVPVNFTNYSSAKNSLLNAFSALVGIPQNTLITPDAEIINRSLSDAETYIQKKFNEKYGREAHKFISDPLCEKLIHIKSGKPRLSEKSFLSFKEKKNEKIAAFNTKYAVSDSQKFDLICEDDYFKSFSTEPDVNNISISYDQLDLLIESLDKELTNPFRSLKRYVKQNLKIGFPKE
jgi:hypothetical protein